MERVHYGPVVRAHIKSDEVAFTIVPRATSRGYVGLNFTWWVGKVTRMGPSGRGMSRTEHLIHSRLLHESYRGIQLEEFEYALQAILDVQDALPSPVYVMFDLGGT